MIAFDVEEITQKPAGLPIVVRTRIAGRAHADEPRPVFDLAQNRIVSGRGASTVLEELLMEDALHRHEHGLPQNYGALAQLERLHRYNRGFEY